ncbi:hypothetical protein C5167_014924 [Papaver somniferum]|uniref:Uncharacterized protein n=1 Tax=Papaver somniferum TaxID=3469 RepID=A0A4Y7J5G7_PAPSO|nr:hypothetical protein C5167_014924 [Papaver somniferum]
MTMASLYQQQFAAATFPYSSQHHQFISSSSLTTTTITDQKRRWIHTVAKKRGKAKRSSSPKFLALSNSFVLSIYVGSDELENAEQMFKEIQDSGSPLLEDDYVKWFVHHRFRSWEQLVETIEKLEFAESMKSDGFVLIPNYIRAEMARHYIGITTATTINWIKVAGVHRLISGDHSLRSFILDVVIEGLISPRKHLYSSDILLLCIVVHYRPEMG